MTTTTIVPRSRGDSHTEELASAALELAAAGRPIFPLRAGTKDRPLTRWRRGGEAERATADHSVITAWWARWPDANIGITTGRGLVVIDVDPRHGGVIDPGWPATLTAHTPSGGSHHYYSTDYAIPSSADGRIGPGIDVRGEGGMVVAPPSCRPDGLYVWLDTNQPIVPLPEVLARAACEAPGRPVGGTRSTGAPEPFDLPDVILAGARNDTLYRYACSLIAYDYTPAEVSAALELANRSITRPPLGREELRAVVASAERHR